MEDLIHLFEALPEEKKIEFILFIRFLKDTEDTVKPPPSLNQEGSQK